MDRAVAESVSLFIPRESGFHRLHPLTKLTLAGFFIITGLVIPSVWGTFLVFALEITPFAIWAKVWRTFLNRVVKVVLPFAISLVLVQGFFWGVGTPLFFIGPLSMKMEGLLFAVTSTGRILVIMASFMMVSLTTRPDALMIALSRAGLPGSITYITLTTIQIVPRFQAKAATILDAQRARGLETEGNLIHRGKALLPLITPLVLGSLIEIEDRAIALEARAFSRRGSKTSLMVLNDSKTQITVRWLLVILGLFLIGTRLWLELRS